MDQDYFGESIEMYLKSIAELAIEPNPVPITRIAKRLRITTVSASEMIHRLEEKGLLNHIPYKGVQLTDEGCRWANGVIRRQRLWERFLIDNMGMPWGHAYGYACRLEHATDPEVADALDDYLDHPSTCPHGNPIPSSEGKCDYIGGASLAELTAGEGGTILSVYPLNEEMLNHILTLGLKPGQRVEVEDIAPFNGPITLRIAEHTVAIGREVASYVMIDTES